MSSSAGIIIIGDEILSGRTKDTNINWIAVELNQMGINLKEARVIEDDKRLCEKEKKFDEKFIKLSRDVHFLNDERARVKLEINTLMNSNIKEIKEYTDY